MSETDDREAWVAIPTEEQARAARPPDAPRHPYDFGFLPAMGRLLMAHPRIGMAAGAAFYEVMFSPESTLSRAEREMLAAVSAAAQDCHY